MMPESRRATRIPKIMPDMTMEIMVARCRGGAYWTAMGNMSCGVTVSIPTTKDSPRKTEKDVVRVKPSHCV